MSSASTNLPVVIDARTWAASWHARLEAVARGETKVTFEGALAAARQGIELLLGPDGDIARWRAASAATDPHIAVRGCTALAQLIGGLGGKSEADWRCASLAKNLAAAAGTLSALSATSSALLVSRAHKRAELKLTWVDEDLNGNKYRSGLASQLFGDLEELSSSIALDAVVAIPLMDDSAVRAAAWEARVVALEQVGDDGPAFDEELLRGRGIVTESLIAARHGLAERDPGNDQWFVQWTNQLSHCRGLMDLSIALDPTLPTEVEEFAHEMGSILNAHYERLFEASKKSHNLIEACSEPLAADGQKFDFLLASQVLADAPLPVGVLERSRNELRRLIAIEVNKLAMYQTEVDLKSEDPAVRETMQTHPKGQCLLASRLTEMVGPAFGFTAETMPVKVEVDRRAVNPTAIADTEAVSADPARAETLRRLRANARVRNAKMKRMVDDGKTMWAGHMVALLDGFIVDPTAAQMDEGHLGRFIPDSVIIAASQINAQGVGSFTCTGPSAGTGTELTVTMHYKFDPTNVREDGWVGWKNPNNATAANMLIARVEGAARSRNIRTELRRWFPEDAHLDTPATHSAAVSRSRAAASAAQVHERKRPSNSPRA
ncbi:MAG: hypothetical protein HOQ05_12795 [Corynebacteriales bacterium]|nr:hypothetical protein [Mycobacteriales bacterium]